MRPVRYRIAPYAGGDAHVAARSLLHALLHDEFGIEGSPRLAHDALGAPYLPDYPHLHVSISHCKTAVAVAALEGGTVGIDVESRRRVSESLIQRTCNEAEREAIQAADDPTMAFLRLWTRKEALLKMRGTGIRGFGSVVHALEAEGVEFCELPTHSAEVVASLCVEREV